MAQFFTIHADNPQLRYLRQAAAIVREGGLIIYPTDSGYALGCRVGDKQAVDKLRKIRNLEPEHHLTLVCRDLSELSVYAKVDNVTYRILRAHTPGPYTFILPATREVPRRLQHPKRKSIGLRVPDNAITLALLDVLEAPLISTTLTLPSEETPMIEPRAMRDVLGNQVDVIIDGGFCGLEPTTVVEFIDNEVNIVRVGKGDPTPFAQS